jgi:2Fe-2S ferredoxin
LEGASRVAYDRAMDVAVVFRPSGLRLAIETGATLLEAARRAGLPIASACGADGICGRCAVRVLSGAGGLSPESEAEARVKRSNRIASELRLACRARILGPVEIGASYW